MLYIKTFSKCRKTGWKKNSPVNKHTVDADLYFKVSHVIKMMSFEGGKSSLSTGQAECLHFLLM